MGLELVITELDVRERDLVQPAAVRDELVAAHVGQYLDAALEHPAVKGVITWGISDRHSWLQLTAEDIGRFPGAWSDGSSPGLNRGLPYDSDLRSKPMREAIARAFQRRTLRTRP
ncbi:Endo-1,4-beta-xylanase A precursor [compost metagenome]